MKIYLLHDPKLFDQCARFSHIGTWTSGKLCERCGQPISMLTEPLQIEWEPGSDFICDFSWCGYVAVVKETVGKYLQKEGFECNLGIVSYVKPTTKSKKIIPFPYTGPELNWLILSEKIPLNEKKSGVELVINCDECGQKKYSFKTEGIVIDKLSWLGQKIFYVEQFSRSRTMFVTEESITILQELGNVAFSEAGVIS